MNELPTLIVSCGGENRFAIPQSYLVELVRLEGEQVARIEQVQGARVYRLRGAMLPLIVLRDQLGLPSPDESQQAVNALNIVVVQAEARRFGLVVDAIHGTEVLDIQPTTKYLNELPAFAGAAITGEGQLLLLLNIPSFVPEGIDGRAPREEVNDHELADIRVASSAVTESWLVFTAGAGSRCAVPLAAVTRLEQLPLSKLERSGGSEVVQYRGEIMPLVRVADVLNLPAPSDTDPLQVVIHRHRERTVGLLVGSILDVVDESVAGVPGNLHRGLSHSAVLQGRVTDLLNLDELLATVIGLDTITATGMEA